ncbi:MAG TPA: ABC transporter ATP-binding protein [Planctomycetota bacterium]|nr:ABC transporter ATP-binding protein [Planctomycetota bacterium]
MTAALEVRGITRKFQELTAVSRVSFSVEPGEIYGFIGPNGAGKTTTMRICATLDLPDTGDVFVDGTSVIEEPRLARAKIGFMPDSYGAYPHTTIREYLDFYARAYGLRGKARAKSVAEVLDFTSLTQLDEKPIDKLSKGMKQRLCLAKTLLPDPHVLILDEPAAGLDPRARVELRELVKALGAMGKAVLISSHILSELAEMCDGIAVIESGKLLANGSVAEIQKRLQPHLSIYLRTLGPVDETHKALLEEAQVSNVHEAREGLAFDFAGDDAAMAELLARLVLRGVRPVEFAGEAVRLEDLFMSLTEGKLQ